MSVDITTYDRNTEKYVIGDALEYLQKSGEKADLIYLDDAWARPQRAGQFGVEYPTHGFDESGRERAPDDSLTTSELLKACKEALTAGGWLIADADDWLLPKLIQELQEEWGNVAKTYSGGGYRRIGGVTYIQKSAFKVDRSSAGKYLSNGGYPVVFAHKGETERESTASARQLAHKPTKNFGWGSVKPIEPYKRWIDALLENGDKILVPCAGTAPAAIAVEQLEDKQIDYTCIDIDPRAREAFEQRRETVQNDGDPDQRKLPSEY
ncbi:polyamine aminopropyltransferase [Natronolimnobius baerhuensis]|uniref:DNA methylase N-4/N-6 domain-containing protein n=1 Tax=Natronolimnobius baerhuensis TaxID=253108 RepID=A0A202E405_9EURY|nr:hypothetical protein [Natronolimnobius baerhuensis]OVE82959.1 hypothetical protein B2G88_18390 [Natronolimnobius baerhuensis]